MKYTQGDIVRIGDFKNLFLIVSNNAFIRTTGEFHVCPLLDSIPAGPLHICITGITGIKGTAICEQLKLIDPAVRRCTKKDRIPYVQMIDISDAIQGVFEYDLVSSS